jgi:hypothetical protein
MIADTNRDSPYDFLHGSNIYKLWENYS